MRISKNETSSRTSANPTQRTQVRSHPTVPRAQVNYILVDEYESMQSGRSSPALVHQPNHVNALRTSSVHHVPSAPLQEGNFNNDSTPQPTNDLPPSYNECVRLNLV
jgi:hypothetical protein